MSKRIVERQIVSDPSSTIEVERLQVSDAQRASVSEALRAGRVAASLDRIIQQEQANPQQVHVGADVTPDGIEASASVDIGRHAQAGGFFRRGWNGMKSWGARFTFSK